jgi:hypothetical protein
MQERKERPSFGMGGLAHELMDGWMVGWLVGWPAWLRDTLELEFCSAYEILMGWDGMGEL